MAGAMSLCAAASGSAPRGAEAHRCILTHLRSPCSHIHDTAQLRVRKPFNARTRATDLATRGFPSCSAASSSIRRTPCGVPLQDSAPTHVSV